MEDNKWLNIVAKTFASNDTPFYVPKDGTPIHYGNKVVGAVMGSGAVMIQELEIPQQAVPYGYLGTRFHLVLAENQVEGMGYYVYNSIREDPYERTLVHEVVTVDRSETNKGTVVTYRFPSGSVMTTRKRTERTIVQLPAPAVSSVVAEPVPVVSVPEPPVPTAVQRDLLDDIEGNEDDPAIPLTKNGKPYWVAGGRNFGFMLEEGKVYKWSGVSEGLYTIYRWRDEKFRVEKVKKKGVIIYDMEDNKMMEISDKYLMDNDVMLKKSGRW